MVWMVTFAIAETDIPGITVTLSWILVWVPRVFIMAHALRQVVVFPEVAFVVRVTQDIDVKL